MNRWIPTLSCMLFGFTSQVAKLSGSAAQSSATAFAPTLLVFSPDPCSVQGQSKSRQRQHSRPIQQSMATTTSTDSSGSAPTDSSHDSDADALFGRFVIPSSSIFLRTLHSTAFVNLRPLVPGHVLVMSNRCVPRLYQLNDIEYADVWHTVRRVQDILQAAVHATQEPPQQQGHEPTEAIATPVVSFNVAIQDGATAGQSVPHVHVHILPRQEGDYERNDDIYQDLEQWAPRSNNDSTKTTEMTTSTMDDAANNGTKLPTTSSTSLHVPDQRRDRTVQEMADEAAVYRNIVAAMNDGFDASRL